MFRQKLNKVDTINRAVYFEASKLQPLNIQPDPMGLKPIIPLTVEHPEQSHKRNSYHQRLEGC